MTVFQKALQVIMKTVTKMKQPFTNYAKSSPQDPHRTLFQPHVAKNSKQKICIC